MGAAEEQRLPCNGGAGFATGLMYRTANDQSPVIAFGVSDGGLIVQCNLPIIS